MKRKKTRSIVIIGRRWFDRVNGNTYNTAQIIINGETVHSLPFDYGYGDNYADRAQQWLTDNGYLPDRAGTGNDDQTKWTPHEPMWKYCKRMNIKYIYTASNVGRKKDL